MIKWIKLSFQGRDAKTSSKRITGFWFVVLTTLIVFAGIHNIYTCNDLPTNYLYFLGIMVTVVLLLFMVVTFESITDLVRAIRNKDNTDSR